MKIKEITDSWTMFSYYDLGIPTNIFIIKKGNNLTVIDTYLGQHYIKNITDNISHSNLCVFNSHYDWDHIWGNYFFSNDKIISSEKTKQNIIKYSEKQKKSNPEFIHEKFEIVLPNFTFEENYENENFRFFITPGHTEDSSSLFDKDEKILFTGDNLELPVPYYKKELKDIHIKTLENYMNIDWEILLNSHNDRILTKNDLEKNIKYLKEE